MPSIQGEFANEAAAQKAIAVLTDAGVPKDRIRLWNIIPSSQSDSSAEEGAARGAVIGGVLGGASGLVAGAAIGTTLEGASGAEERLPDPTGVRLVVDTSPTGPDVASLLRSAGAANVR